jgi:hypothetical protein
MSVVKLASMATSRAIASIDEYGYIRCLTSQRSLTVNLLRGPTERTV